MKKSTFNYKVDEESILFDFLLNHVNDSKNNIKSFLKNGNVYVNDKNITKYDYKLNINDFVSIKTSHNSMVLYEDKDLVIVNKPSGLLTVSTEKSNNTLYRQVSSYVKESNKNNKVFIVNRLDKDTSGIVVFAKNERIKLLLQDNWNDLVKTREYIAVVEGVTDEKGLIKSYLSENKEHIVYSSKSGKLAITEYERIKYNDIYSMLRINLHTGRKNQIRVHMKDINHPVVGDSKYGNKSKYRLMLHSNKIEFMFNNKLITVESKYPKEFDDLFRR